MCQAHSQITHSYLYDAHKKLLISNHTRAIGGNYRKLD